MTSTVMVAGRGTWIRDLEEDPDFAEIVPTRVAGEPNIEGIVHTRYGWGSDFAGIVFTR